MLSFPARIYLVYRRVTAAEGTDFDAPMNGEVFAETATAILQEVQPVLLKGLES
jgi:hypothetical protein